MNEEFIKECEDTIKLLTELFNNCSNALEGSYVNSETGLLREILKNVIDKLHELDPQNVLFQKK